MIHRTQHDEKTRLIVVNPHKSRESGSAFPAVRRDLRLRTATGSFPTMEGVQRDSAAESSAIGR